MAAVTDPIAAAPRRRADSHRGLVFVLLAPVLAFFVGFNTIPLLWLLGHRLSTVPRRLQGPSRSFPRLV